MPARTLLLPVEWAIPLSEGKQNQLIQRDPLSSEIPPACELAKKNQGKLAGATGWLVKPIPGNDLTAVIQKVLPGA